MRWILLAFSLLFLCAIVYALLLVLPSIPIIDCNRELSGALIAAAGTIFAAIIAWVALTTQLDEQRIATKIAARTYWQSQRENAATTLSGMRLVLRTATSAVDAYNNRDRKTQFPAVDGLKQIQKTGVLDVSNFPPTGPELFAWDINIYVGTLRIWWFRVGSGQNAQDLPEAEKVIDETMGQIATLRAALDASLKRAEQDVTRAQDTLLELDSQ